VHDAPGADREIVELDPDIQIVDQRPLNTLLQRQRFNKWTRLLAARGNCQPEREDPGQGYEKGPRTLHATAIIMS
jgi:hypothetical protein